MVSFLLSCCVSRWTSDLLTSREAYLLMPPDPAEAAAREKVYGQSELAPGVLEDTACRPLFPQGPAAGVDSLEQSHSPAADDLTCSGRTKAFLEDVPCCAGKRTATANGSWTRTDDDRDVDGEGDPKPDPPQRLVLLLDWFGWNEMPLPLLKLNLLALAVAQQPNNRAGCLRLLPHQMRTAGIAI